MKPMKVDGKKTYICCALLVVQAALKILNGDMTLMDALTSQEMTTILGSGAFASARHTVTKIIAVLESGKVRETKA